MSIECNVVKQNLGMSKCNKLPQLYSGMITTPLTFSISAVNAADPALLLTALQTAIKNGIATRCYKWPDFATVEAVNEDAVYEENPLMDIPVRDGKYRWRVGIAKNLCFHKAAYSHRGGDQRVFFIDIEGNLFCTKLSDGTYAGFKVSMLNTEKLMISDGQVATKSPIYIVLSNNKEIDKNGYLLDGSNLGELIPLTDVTLTISPAAIEDATILDVAVKVSCDDTPVSGLVAADFTIVDANGDAQVPTTPGVETPAGSGIYRFIKSTNFVAGEVDLVAASALSVDAYESTGAAAFTIAP